MKKIDKNILVLSGEVRQTIVIPIVIDMIVNKANVIASIRD